MGPQSPSRSAGIAYRLVTFMLVVTVAFCAFALAATALGVARGGESPLWGDALTVPLELDPHEVGPLPAGVRLRGLTEVSLEVADPSTRQMLLRTAIDVGPILLFAAGLWLLWGIARTVTRGDPFGAANVARLRRIGFLLVLGGPAVELLNASLRSALYNVLPPTPSVDLGVAGFRFPAGALLAGLGAFVLAEVFAHGVRLREGVEATI